MFVHSSAQDEIFLHNGKVEKGKVVENEPEFIKFVYEGEDISTTFGKVAIEKIKYRSGRVEECSQKIVINDPSKDFDKILILRDKDECTGLVRIQEFTEKSGGVWSIGATAGKYEQKTLKKLQKRAASLGGCAILITSQASKGAGFFRNPDAKTSAVVYAYSANSITDNNENKKEKSDDVYGY